MYKVFARLLNFFTIWINLVNPAFPWLALWFREFLGLDLRQA